MENADPAPRTTFIKFYEGTYGITASSFEILPKEGFVIVGTMVSDSTYTIIITTDKSGNRTKDFAKFSGGTGKAIKPIMNGDSIVTHYIVVGDSIKINPFADQVANVTISSLRGLILSSDLTLVRKFAVADLDPDTTRVKEDFTGEALKVTDDGRLFILGTAKKGVPNQVTAPAEPFIKAFKSDFTKDWQKRYELNGRTSQNSRSIQYSNGKIIWASAIADETGGFTNSWIGIPIIDENSVYPNYSVLGQNTAQKFVPKDIQPASEPSFGYGVVGTYSEDTDGSKGNIFFLRVYANGTIVPDSDRYFDGGELLNTGNKLDDRKTSVTIDEGEALTATKDGGFVLAGTFKSTSSIGNGGLDLFLIKVNALGDLVWFKTFGGAGDETPVAIHEDASGNLIVGGTNKLGDYATVFLMKTDKNGELKK
ncbi:MAG: hypothetical protein JNM78_07515 [Cyclobacteriaceae bacterium]|nr:hypothetical protein [Cyclobacteriaceae bacterium]